MTDKNENNYILKTYNLTVVRNGKTLLERVNLRIKHGSLIMLLGHNGAGKSVLLRTLHGLLAITDGDIKGPPAERQKIVFQKPILLRRSARKHFRFVCPSCSDKNTEAWFAHANLEAQMDTHAHQLSGGEQQKLALIGALASQPSLLFLDEPTSHLDYESTTAIEQMIKDAHAGGTTIIMTSHNRAQAERLAQHVLFIHAGQLLESRLAADFFHKPSDPIADNFLNHL